jgi:hypothetical protein
LDGPPSYKKTSIRREHRRAQTGTRLLEFKVTATLK